MATTWESLFTSPPPNILVRMRLEGVGSHAFNYLYNFEGTPDQVRSLTLGETETSAASCPPAQRERYKAQEHRFFTGPTFVDVTLLYPVLSLHNRAETVLRALDLRTSNYFMAVPPCPPQPSRPTLFFTPPIWSEGKTTALLCKPMYYCFGGHRARSIFKMAVFQGQTVQLSPDPFELTGQMQDLILHPGWTDQEEAAVAGWRGQLGRHGGARGDSRGARRAPDRKAPVAPATANSISSTDATSERFDDTFWWVHEISPPTPPPDSSNSPPHSLTRHKVVIIKKLNPQERPEGHFNSLPKNQ
ncbi:hypothetical protein DFH09DRAFT_1314272 [Mycena vulgaris]|nr:hypothetical protein DFH09DRAFT_1314272 [Mycena vulgaris]